MSALRLCLFYLLLLIKLYFDLIVNGSIARMKLTVFTHVDYGLILLKVKWSRLPPLDLIHRPPFVPVQQPLASHASERHQTFPVWYELKQNRTRVYFYSGFRSITFILCSLCLCKLKNIHTHFSFWIHFAQTLSLVLYSPPLEQLLEESWLCPVIDRLHICCVRVVFGFDELLHRPIRQKPTHALL